VEITEVRIKLMGEATEHRECERTTSNERLRAFASITVENHFVIREALLHEGVGSSPGRSSLVFAGLTPQPAR